MTTSMNGLPYNLPRINSETAEAVSGDVHDKGQDFLADAQARLREQNPLLEQTVGQYATLLGMTSQEDAIKVYSLLLMTHELLRTQSETDRLNSQFPV